MVHLMHKTQVVHTDFVKIDHVALLYFEGKITSRPTESCSWQKYKVSCWTSGFTNFADTSIPHTSHV